MEVTPGSPSYLGGIRSQFNVSLHVKEEGLPTLLENNQWAISARSAPWTAIGFNVRIPIEIAADISLVNRRAVGTTS